MANDDAPLALDAPPAGPGAARQTRAPLPAAPRAGTSPLYAYQAVFTAPPEPAMVLSAARCAASGPTGPRAAAPRSSTRS